MLVRPNRNSLSPWQEMGKLQREMNRLFETALSPGYRQAPSFPAMNVWTSENGLTVTAELRFRRAFWELMENKGWNTQDIVMEQSQIVLTTRPYWCWFLPFVLNSP